MARPTERTALHVLTRARLLELADAAGLALSRNTAKPDLVEALAGAPIGFDELLSALKRDDLKEICRAFALDDGGREKAPLIARILAALDGAPALAPAPVPTPARPPALPQLPLAEVPAASASTTPTPRSVLAALTPARLVDVARLFGVPGAFSRPPSSRAKARQISLSSSRLRAERSSSKPSGAPARASTRSAWRCSAGDRGRRRRRARAGAHG